MDDKAKKSADFILGSKAADLWLYTCDACANEKVIPKKYRYTTGTGLMNAAEEICDLNESANLLDLREYPRERLGMQRRALAEIRRAALNLPAPEPAIIERRTKRYGTVTFQSDERQSGQAGREHPGKEIHQAGQ